jgi:hypothetical protein
MLGHERSEEWYDTSDLLELCTSYHYQTQQLESADMILSQTKKKVPFSTEKCILVYVTHGIQKQELRESSQDC